MYEPLAVTECEKCGKVIAEPKEQFGIQSKILSQLLKTKA